MSSMATESTTRIEASAADWVLRQCDSGEWSDEDQIALDAWLAAHPAHLIAYARLHSAWSNTDRLAVLRENLGTAPRKLRRLLADAAVICSLIVVVGITATYSLLSGVHGRIYATSIGGRRVIQLNDGSRIELNTDTRLRARVAAAQRTVWIDKGEAYFRIRHDAAHPFVIMAGNRRITDLGTEFSIRRDNDRVEITFVSGRAWFDAANGHAHAPSLLLLPGDDVISTSANTTVMKKPVQQISDKLGWRRGVLIFDHTALTDAAAEFNRYNQRKLVVADRSASRIAIGGTFDMNNVAAFADVLRDDMRLRVEEHADAIVISR